MVKIRNLFNFIFVSILLKITTVFAVVETKALQSIKANLLFSTSLESPSNVHIHGDKLWSYSVSTQSLVALDKKQGVILKNYPLDSLIRKTESSPAIAPWEVTAMASQGKRFLILAHQQATSSTTATASTSNSTSTSTTVTNSDSRSLQKNQILELSTENEIKVLNKFSLPEKGHASDLFCSEKKCYVIQEKVYQSQDLKQWSVITIPPLEDIKLVNSKKELNPFEGWQDRLNLAKPKFTHGAVTEKGNLILLDPFQLQIVVETTTIASTPTFNKWGKYGAWEGNFLLPKSFTYLGSDKIAILDAKLKAVFIYQTNGIYLGILSLKEGTPSVDEIYSTDFALSIDHDQSILYLADFRANKVIALETKLETKLKSELETKQETKQKAKQDTKLEDKNLFPEPSLAVRTNLFRREAVLKDSPSSLCLQCHDGSISSHLYKFAKLKNHHPLECSQCHEPHHILKNQHSLKSKPYELCLSCHKEFAKQDTNHVGSKASFHNKKGGNCIDCHVSHSDSEKLLIKPQPQLCESCHQEYLFDHRSPQKISQLDKASKVQLNQDGNINCNTCHQTHRNWREIKFLKSPDEILPFCSSCHGEKSPPLFKKFHKLIKHKKGGKP